MSLIFKNGKMYGGNDVAANPTLTPSTRDLGSISIDGVAYNVGGNTGTAYKETVLWEGSESTSRWAEPIVLQNIDIGAYDQIIVDISGGQHIISANQIPFGDVSGSNSIYINGYLDDDSENQRSIWVNRDIGNIFRVFCTTGKGVTLTKVVGIKTGVGGGATSADWKLLASVTGSEVVDISNYYARADEFNIVLKVDGYDDQVLTTTFPKSAIPESNGRISLGRNYYDALVKISPAGIQLYQCRGNSSEDVLSTTTMDVYYRKSGAQICFGFIDTTNVIVPQTNYTGTMSYTATQDCWVALDMYATNGVSDAYIDGVRIGVIYSNANTSSSTTIPLRKGQTLSVTADDLGWYAVYGIARGSEVPAYDLVRGNVYGAFIDTNRLIKSTTAIPANTDVTYTATDDCAVIFALINAQNQNYSAWIDGIPFCSSWGQTGAKSGQQMVYLKRGQTIKFNQTYTGADGGYEVYGLSYGTQNIFTPQIYSLEEKCVGVWIDNKPLYQKTLVYNNITKGRVDNLAHNISDIDKIVYNDWVFVNSQNHQSVTGFENTSNNYWAAIFSIGDIGISYRIGTDWAVDTLIVNVKYTKTTDVAGSGSYNTLGVPMVHIEDNVETVIGTYNGKPLYQMKTSFTVNTTQQLNGFYRGDADLSSIMPTDVDRVLETLSNMQNPNSASRGFITSWYESDVQSLFYLCLFSVSGNTGHTIIKYTKTTD